MIGIALLKPVFKIFYPDECIIGQNRPVNLDIQGIVVVLNNFQLIILDSKCKGSFLFKLLVDVDQAPGTVFDQTRCSDQ